MNDNLDRAAKEYADSFHFVAFYTESEMRAALREAFEDGAQWQKTQKSDMQKLWEQSIQLDGLYTFDDAPAACPPGYRPPTGEEQKWLLANTDFSFDEDKKEGVFRFADGFELRLPANGFCANSDGSSYYRGSDGYYWSSSVSGIYARNVRFNSGAVGAGRNSRANGCSVRCLPIIK